jgi:polysaccharide export outer membrane protein
MSISRLCRIFFLLLFCLCVLSGCASDLHSASATDEAAVIAITPQLLDAERQRASAPPVPDVPAPAGTSTDGAYHIGPGDVLAITVWDHPELTGAVARDLSADAYVQGPPAANFVVDQQGQLNFPFAGTITLAGLTREQARTLLATRLARYFRDPRVTLSVQAYRSQRVYIDGEVKAPGLQAINDIPMTLLEALNRAGGLLPTADQSRITVERGGQRHRIDLLRTLAGGRHPAVLMLADGDIVRVPPRDESKVFVAGEVLTPRALTMHDGRLTLNEALGETGGINPLSGDTRQIYVVRKSTDRTRVFQLDARDTGSLAIAEAFELRPKDVVYVAASPLANWNRNLSLLFPGALTSAVGITRP